MPRHLIAFALPLLLLCACAESDSKPDPLPDPDAASTFGQVEVTADGKCFTRSAPRARTAVVTELVEVAPAVLDDDGTVVTPPIFRNLSRPVTEAIAAGVRFETVCPAELTTDRIATLQRALKVRQAYGGPISAVLDTATTVAIRQFQAPLGYDSPLLERSVAQTLGVIPVDSAAL